ncbi:hypothetical protein EJ03DRAFT_379237 [Teratosphaeria nubilosa]|uniref:Altered inheritance of mitochondria protein 9, mitochondrial n=1 Tax=Teratosphaeria nubilosa TaxID=161662 RepID=A0A6G1KSL6_9PEZI|nr:hypothetical protein EJ03DRAFT_379237 [Teratosphaeria nubilosa]
MQRDAVGLLGDSNTAHSTMLSRFGSVFKRSSARGRALSTNHDCTSLYGHTSGRWLGNEEVQTQCRWRKFNITELAQAAASAAGAHSCVKLAKLSEGSYNKAALLSMDNGKEIVAKLPNPNAGYDHFTTASEVATMDYGRNVLGVPVPSVYAWRSSADNPVGAEYILMEKCPGAELHKVWPTITDRQKAAIVHKLVSDEAAFASSRLPMYGSLYYAKDLKCPKMSQAVLPSKSKATLPHFAIGPTTDRNFYDHGRAGATSNRGPWSTELTAIIDWQAVHAAPLCAQARHPTFLEFDGGSPDTFDADAIKLPDNFEDLSKDEQLAAKTLRGAQILWKLYGIELECQCSDIRRALRFGQSLLGRLPSLAGNIFSDGELLVQGLLMQLQQQWNQLVDDPVAEPRPLAFTAEDKAVHDELYALWTQSIELMTEFLNSIGGYRGWDGSVSHEQTSTFCFWPHVLSPLPRQETFILRSTTTQPIPTYPQRTTRSKYIHAKMHVSLQTYLLLAALSHLSPVAAGDRCLDSELAQLRCGPQATTVEECSPKTHQWTTTIKCATEFKKNGCKCVTYKNVNKFTLHECHEHGNYFNPTCGTLIR